MIQNSSSLQHLATFQVNIPLLEALQKMSGYAKFIEDLVTKKRVMDFETIEVKHNYSAIMTSTMVMMKKNPDAFIIPCTIRVYEFEKASCDLGASINLMLLAMFRKVGLGSLL